MRTTTNTRYLILKDMTAEYSTRYAIKTLAAGEVVTRKEFIEFFECHLANKGNGYYREDYDEYSYALCLKTKTLRVASVTSGNLGMPLFPPACRKLTDRGQEVDPAVLKHARLINSVVLPILYVPMNKIASIVTTDDLCPEAKTLIKARLEGII